MVKLSEEELAANRENNQHVRSASFNKAEGFKDRLKGIFSSDSKSENK